MRLTKLPSEASNQLRFTAHHERGSSIVALAFWIGFPAGFCHKFEAQEDGHETPASDTFIADARADMRKQVLSRLPELLEIRAPSNHALMELEPILDDIAAFEKEARPLDNPFDITPKQATQPGK